MPGALCQKYAVIGASQSGKTTWIVDSLIKPGHYKKIILCGACHNEPVYKKVLPAGVKFKYYGNNADVVLGSLGRLINGLQKILKENPKTVLPSILVLFDDFIDPKAIKDQRFIDFLAICRHYGISICYVAHSTDVVLSPFIKNNITRFVICQYNESSSFSEFMGAFLDPKLSDLYFSKYKSIPSKKSLEDLRKEILTRAFGGRYGKLIIDEEGRRFAIIEPKERLKEKDIQVSASSLLD